MTRYDLCLIGGGSAGLSIAAGAAQMGSSVVLVERAKMGGDCLNYGCVPSKAFLSAGKKAKTQKSSARFGVADVAPTVNFSAVMDHVADVIAQIAPHDSVERFESLGVRVICAQGVFEDRHTLCAGSERIIARRFVIATGSRPFIPPIDGLEAVPFLTNETVFSLREQPQKLIVIGGGPIGCELGQGFANLGTEVSLIANRTLMPKDDPELVDIIRQRFLDDGLTLYENTRVQTVEKKDDRIIATIETEQGSREIQGTHLLLATGRRPNLGGLNLEAAGVEWTESGIVVDKGLRTSNRKIYAAGDVTGGYQFTHMAGYDAGIVIKSALFRLPARVHHNAVPWVTYSDPELAHVGLSEHVAKTQGHQILTWSFADNDRARAERRTEGRIKVIIDKRGRILGASVVGLNAGELILPWSLAISQGLKIGAIANLIAPYPTLSEVSKRVAGHYYTPALFSARVKKIVRFLARFG